LISKCDSNHFSESDFRKYFIERNRMSAKSRLIARPYEPPPAEDPVRSLSEVFQEKGGKMKTNQQRAWNILFLLVFFIAFPLTAQATMHRMTVDSDSSAKFFYDGLGGDSYPVTREYGLPTGWNNNSFNDTGWSPAQECPYPAWLAPTRNDPQNDPPPYNSTSAQWITPINALPESCKGPDYLETSGARGIYLYRQVFQMPGTAYNVSGQAAMGADNYGWMDINGIQVLEPANKSQSDGNYALPSTGPIPASVTGSLNCKNVLAAEVHNGISISRNGPTGVIFSITLDYEIPNVMWKPPITNPESFFLKDGTSLPLKFNLVTSGGTLITEPKNVYLAVYREMSEGGELIEDWHLGEGIDNLRFGNPNYIAIFKTKSHDLLVGESYKYTAYVQDGCTGLVLGSVSFKISNLSGTNRGQQ
jgi:hypothetical protein